MFKAILILVVLVGLSYQVDLDKFKKCMFSYFNINFYLFINNFFFIFFSMRWNWISLQFE